MYNIHCINTDRALHRGLSKYLTAPGTHVRPTLIKHNRPLGRRGNLFSLQLRSILQENRAFSVPSIKYINQKLDKALKWEQKNPVFPFLKLNRRNRWF